MRVHVKKPLISVQITGHGAQLVLETLKKIYTEIEVTDDDPLVDIETTEWFKSTMTALTPGEVLATYRDNADMTLDALATKSGIPKSNLSALENNKRPIGLKTAKKLAGVFGCDYRIFFLN